MVRAQAEGMNFQLSVVSFQFLAAAMVVGAGVCGGGGCAFKEAGGLGLALFATVQRHEGSLFV